MIPHSHKAKHKMNAFHINIMFRGKRVQHTAGKMIAIKSFLKAEWYESDKALKFLQH